MFSLQLSPYRVPGPEEVPLRFGCWPLRHGVIQKARVRSRKNFEGAYP